MSGGEGGTQRWRRHSPIIYVSTAVLCKVVVGEGADVMGSTPSQKEGKRILNPTDHHCDCQRSLCPPLLENRLPLKNPCPYISPAHIGVFTYELASGTPIDPAGARSRVVIATELRSVGVHRIASRADIVAATGAAVVVVITITTTTTVTFGIDRHCTGLPRLLRVFWLVVGR